MRFMKKLGIIIGIIIMMSCFFLLSIYDFQLNEDKIGKIEVRTSTSERVPLSREESILLIDEINKLNYRLGSEGLKIEKDGAGYNSIPCLFNLFIYDKKGNPLASIGVYDEKNISYSKEFNGGLGLHYHATTGKLNLDTLAGYL